MCLHLYLNEYVLTYMYHNSLLRCNIATLLFCIWYRYGSTCKVILACLEHGNEIQKLQYYHHHFHLGIVVEVISDLGRVTKHKDITLINLHYYIIVSYCHFVVEGEISMVLGCLVYMKAILKL